MKSYKLNISVVVVVVGVLSLFIFSALLVIFRIGEFKSVGGMLMNYGFIIAPISVLWVVFDRYLWHTPVLRAFRKSLNIPPDLRGRWEGTLENADGTPPQKFVIEVRQTLTTLKVHSYATVGHSASVLCEISSDAQEENFTLCYLWEGSAHTDIKDMHHAERFQGYTMLNLLEHEDPRELKGAYFTNRKPMQTRGGIQLQWVSSELKRKLE